MGRGSKRRVHLPRFVLEALKPRMVLDGDIGDIRIEVQTAGEFRAIFLVFRNFTTYI
jgi:hypothetical protein